MNPTIFNNQIFKEKFIPFLDELSLSILNIYHADFTTWNKHDKTDGSPLTAADLLAHQKITDFLTHHFPTLPIISEENESFPDQNSSLFWLVDPIDGTKEFIQKRKEFTINIALVQNEKVIFGCIWSPALNEGAWGFIEEGAFIRIGKTPQGPWQVEKISPNPDVSKFRVGVSLSHADPKVLDWGNQFENPEFIGIGSSLKFVRLAQNQIEYYPRFQNLNTWDIAAGHAIVKSSGGNVYLLGTEQEIHYICTQNRTELFLGIAPGIKLLNPAFEKDNR
jgi:3'(2'), 5'-bisphosphate nucleotidase